MVSFAVVEFIPTPRKFFLLPLELSQGALFPLQLSSQRLQHFPSLPFGDGFRDTSSSFCFLVLDPGVRENDLPVVGDDIVAKERQ